MSSDPGKLMPAGGRSADVCMPSGDHEDDHAESPGEPSTRLERIGDLPERCGSVEITRYKKDDGRALLHYRHEAEQSG